MKSLFGLEAAIVTSKFAYISNVSKAMDFFHRSALWENYQLQQKQERALEFLELHHVHISSFVL